MIARRSLRIVVLTALFWFPVLHAQTLRLMCEFDGHAVPVAGLDAKQPYCMVDGKKVLVPSDAVWRLDGDLRATPQLAEWVPDYRLKRIDVSDRELADSSRPYEATVGLAHATEYLGSTTTSPFLERWPAGLSRPALAVLAWVNDGAVLQTAARAIPSTDVKFFFAIHDFQLTPTEARGHAVALVWADGAFIPPAPRFKNSLAESAYLSLMSGNETVAERAFRDGLKPGVVDREGGNMLQYCAGAGRSRGVEILLAAKINPNFNHSRATPPLMLAATKGRTEMVDQLLHAGVIVRDRDRPLHAAINNRHEATALRFLESNVRLDAGDGANRIPLARAIDAGHTALAREILKRQPRFDFSSETMARVLITQAQAGHTAMVRFLLEHKVRSDLEAVGETALIAGARSGDPEIARALIAAGASPAHVSGTKLTALMVAAIAGKVEYAEELLNAGAPIDVAGPDGNTALHLAVSGDALKMVELLLQRGARHDIANAQGELPLLLALARRASGIVTTLAANGAKLDIKHPKILDYLETALALDASEILRAAISDGWPTSTLWRGDWSALRIAEVCDAKRSLELLRTTQSEGRERGPSVVLSNRNLDVPVRVAKAVSPVDPRSVRNEHPRATVEVDLVVDTDGTVRFPTIASTSDPWLNVPTLHAVRQWVFTPPRKDDAPVALKVRLPIEYSSSKEKVRDPTELDVTPAPLHWPTAISPIEYRGRGLGGRVLVRFVVNTQGKTEHVHVVESALPLHDAAAVEAVQQWTFEPGEIAGKPVASWFNIPFLFR